MQPKPIILERRAIPELFSSLYLRVFGTDWRRYKRYGTVERATQAHEGLLKTSWNCKFEWRLVTEVGIVRLPVVKA